MKDFIFLCDLLESKDDSERQRGEEFKKKIEELEAKLNGAG